MLSFWILCNGLILLKTLIRLLQTTGTSTDRLLPKQLKHRNSLCTERTEIGEHIKKSQGTTGPLAEIRKLQL